MAIGFARLQHIKRTAGKNMAYKSAYNSKERVEFEGTQFSPPRIYDFSRRGEKPISSSIILPNHVNEGFSNAAYLWNSVEQFEKRKDSQVGIEFVLALPDDKLISNEDRIQMAESFSKKYFVSKGYGAQVDIHPPNQKNRDETDEEVDEENEVKALNWHAHILVTPRHFSEDGKSFKSKKVSDLNPEIRGANHFAFGGIEWGKTWTQFQNEYFEKNGLDIRVDQPGLVAQVHLGPIRMRSKYAYKILNEHDSRGELNQLISTDSDSILQKLTENKSIFIEADVESFLQKNISEAELNKVRESFWKNGGIVQLFDKQSFEPTRKFSSHEVVEEERKIFRLSDRIHQRNGFATNKSEYSKYKSNLNKEQSEAFDKTLDGKAISCIEGLAGTGKSHLLIALKEFYESNGYIVRAFGPDNATVKVLKDKGFSDSSNIHKFLFKNHFSKSKNVIKSEKEIWIVDESSKVGNRSLLELLKAAEKSNNQIIFSGNSAQLTSVDRGGMFQKFCERYGFSFLGEIQRQKSHIDREISKRLATGDIANAIDMISKTGGFIWSDNKNASLVRVVEKWAEDRIHFPYSSSIIIAHTNQEVRQINDLVHTFRKARGEVSEKEFDCSTIFGNIRVSEGDLIEFRNNSKKLKVTNGEKGILVHASEERFIVDIEGKKISFNPKTFTSFQLAYCVTCFRSQGETVDRSYIVYHPQMRQKLLYVGQSRHINKAYCFVSKEDASCLSDIKRQVGRNSEIENTVDYMTEEEIDKNTRTQHRTKMLAELCISDSLVDKTKGYGYKAWDYLKSGIESIVEQAQDVRSNNSFYKVPDEKEGKGWVVQVKEDKLSPNFSPSISTEHKSEDRLKPSKGEGFQKLNDVSKQAYKKYFDKAEESSSFYAIVQSEAISLSISKEYTNSFKAWQKACGERNEAAFELLKLATPHKLILGNKGSEILRDRAARYEESIKPKESIENKLQGNIEALLYTLFPEGPQRRDRLGFRFGSKGSLLVTCVGEKKGCFYNFEQGKGGNLLQLIENKVGLDRVEAISWAKNFLNNNDCKYVPNHFSQSHFSKPVDETWISLMPTGFPPSSLRNFSHYLDENYTLSDLHPYRNIEGEPVFYTLRLVSKSDGKKIVLPLSYGKSHPNNEPAWKLKNHSAKNEILYNMHQLYQDRGKHVLIVEGEKTADAAKRLLGNDYVVVTWAGGSSSTKQTNWVHLYGRNVVIWPDNDLSGFKAADEICSALVKIGVKSLHVVDKDILSKTLPEKWDLADPLPKGKGDRFIHDMLLRAKERVVDIDLIFSMLKENNPPELKKMVAREVLWRVEERLTAQPETNSKPFEVKDAILKETYKIIFGRDKIEKHLLGKGINGEILERVSFQVMIHQARKGDLPSTTQIDVMKQTIQSFGDFRTLDQTQNGLSKDLYQHAFDHTLALHSHFFGEEDFSKRRDHIVIFTKQISRCLEMTELQSLSQSQLQKQKTIEQEI